jgi:hypothetical protein
MSRAKRKLIQGIQNALSQPLNGMNIKALLADTRKLLELVGAAEQYEALKFHCDWILHTKMSKKFASNLLRSFDDVWDKWIVSKTPISNDFTAALPYTIGFYGFEKELVGFLRQFGMNLPFAESKELWQQFERVYCDIVEDAELKYTDKKRQLKHIDGARVKMFRLSESDFTEIKAKYFRGEYLPFGIEWTFTLNGEPVFVVPITFPSAARVERDTAIPGIAPVRFQHS